MPCDAFQWFLFSVSGCGADPGGGAPHQTAGGGPGHRRVPEVSRAAVYGGEGD